MIIAIGGCSRSGKTSLAKMIAGHFDGKIKSCVILSQDDFVFQEELIPKINDHVNWEIPESVDFENFRKTIRRSNRAHDIVIVEGLLIYSNETLIRLYDELIFIHIEESTFYERKEKDERWPEPRWYQEHIWKSFLEYGQHPKSDDILHLSGEEDFDLPEILSELSLL